jgi:DnaJ family protein C protein 8
MEDKKRQELDAAITQARSLLLRAHNLPPAAEDHDPRIQALKPPFREQLRARVRDFLIEEELRRRKCVPSPCMRQGPCGAHTCVQGHKDDDGERGT